MNILFWIAWGWFGCMAGLAFDAKFFKKEKPWRGVALSMFGALVSPVAVCAAIFAFLHAWWRNR